MNKYLYFILIGIILFLILNNIDGLTISSKNIDDRCDYINDPPNICNLSNLDEDPMENITCNYAKQPLFLDGYNESKIRDVRLKNIDIRNVEIPSHIKYVSNLNLEEFYVHNRK